MASLLTERRIFLSLVALLALIPTLVGLGGVVLGPTFLYVANPWPVDLDSHFRFLSGVFMGVGIGFYTCLFSPEKTVERFRLLALLVVLGGLARLYSITVALAGMPSLGHQIGLVMELIVVPGLILWHSRLFKQSKPV